jgi:alpha-N-arabinofuranosidase
MKQFDPDLELVVCGSSSSSMPTFGEWERVVLGHAYDAVDYISCHAYYEDKGDRAAFLASGVDMDRFIRTVVATADHVKEVRGSDRTINISFDEWNIWYNSRFENVDRIEGVDNWPQAPRLLEDVYTVTDAVVFGSLLITLLRHADRVTSASLAQLVNVIAPIMTEPGGPAWRQTTFFPFAATSAHARGTALDLAVRSPTYPSPGLGDVPVVDGVGSYDETAGRYTVHAVNRSLDQATQIRIDVSAIGDALETATIRAQVLTDDDPLAANTLADPDRVRLHDLDVVREGRTLVMTVPPIAWVELRIEA